MRIAFSSLLYKIPKLNPRKICSLYSISFSSKSFSDENYGRALVFEEHGVPSKVLKIKRYERREPTDEEIEIRFLSSPVNPSDVNQIEGVYPKLPTFLPNFGAVGGNEGVAQITRLGKKFEKDSQFTVGQWVLPSKPGFGTWRTFVNVKPCQIQTLPFPPGFISLPQAGTLSVNPCTAYRLLKDFASLSPGDYVIQNGANSGVGRVVIQLCKAWGLKSINIVRDRENPQEIFEDLSALGATYTMTASEIRKSANRELLKSLNIKLGLNCVGGKIVTEMARFIAPGGSLVTYGGMSREPVTLPTGLLIFNDISFRGFWMTQWVDKHSADQSLRHNMWRELMELMNSKSVTVTPHNSLSWFDSESDEQLNSLILGSAFPSRSKSSSLKTIFYM